MARRLKRFLVAARAWRAFTLLAALLLGTPSAFAAHALALGYEPKYPPDFKHFDYVNPDAPKGGELVLSAIGNFDSLNPFILKSVPAAGVSGLMFETLADGANDEPITNYGLLAEDQKLADDKLSVTFRINSKARFSNGDPVTAADVKYSFDTLRGKLAHPQYQFYFADVKQAVLVDPMTIRFEFAKRNAELHIICGSIPVFSKKWGAGKPFNEIVSDPPIGSGPYLIERVDLGRGISYRRNPKYWAKDLPVRRGMFNFDRVIFRYYKDGSVRLEAFKAGEFDFVLENSAKNWANGYKGEKFDRGLIKKAELKHQNAQGIQAFVFNTRRALFKDKRVRKAVALAFDFEWSNRNLFARQYRRNNSFFSNTELGARGLPQADELRLLEPFRDKLPPEVFTVAWQPPNTDIPHSLRQNLREAKKLLESAGWKFKDGYLRNADGALLQFEVLVYDKAFERIFAPFARNLAILGIRATSRIADTALFQRRKDRFDFDMMIDNFSGSQNPGNELTTRFMSVSADQEGSDNTIGIKDPVVDALIGKILSYNERAELIAATRALDRVLLHSEYLVPNWYIAYHRVAYHDKFERPKTAPLYYQAEENVLSTWWVKGK
jgi:microcin C transport system substrate-binding protein